MSPPPTTNKRDQVKLFRLLIGYTRLTHEFLLQREASPCELCDLSRTGRHTILKRRKLDKPRTQIQNSQGTQGNTQFGTK